MSQSIHTTRSEEETQAVASKFAQTLKGGDVVFLIGDLGSGKTTFVRGVARALGFEEPVRSPSFTIVNRYPLVLETLKQILHIDFYRVEDPSEIPPLALEEELGQPDTLAFIEWPERAEGLVSATHIIAFTSHENEYTITID